MKGFKIMTEAIYDAADNAKQSGSVVLPGLWAPDRINYWSAGFSGVIGPKLFEEWLVPEIEEMTRAYKYNMYYLDSSDAVKHLPAIAEVKEVAGIQYTPGPDATLADRLQVYKHIQQLEELQWIGIDSVMLNESW